jgi:CRP-like cAMP-binding protein
MARPGATKRNRILKAMSNSDLALLRPHLEAVPLNFRQHLQSTMRPIKKVYFPESGIASVVAAVNGEPRQVDMAIIGRDGMTGLAVVHGAECSPYNIYMQVEGEGQCINAQNLRNVMRQSDSLLTCLLRYAHVFTVQAGYTALASARGNIKERLARYLLMARDRLDGDEMMLTHRFLSVTLGLQRAGITRTLQSFESEGLIGTAYGSVTIKDRKGLEECANGLYGTPETEFERLFG